MQFRSRRRRGALFTTIGDGAVVATFEGPAFVEIQQEIIRLIKYFHRVAREKRINVSLREMIVKRRKGECERGTSTSPARGPRGSLHLGDDLILAHAVEDVVEQTLRVLAERKTDSS